MLSDPSVQEAASQFVVIKIDPRESRDAMEHKTTQYVPELVVLDSGQNYITTVKEYEPSAMVRALEEAATAARR